MLRDGDGKEFDPRLVSVVPALIPSATASVIVAAVVSIAPAGDNLGICLGFHLGVEVVDAKADSPVDFDRATGDGVEFFVCFVHRN